MQILSSTTDHITGAITVTISYLVHSPFGDTTETNSFQLHTELAADVNAGVLTLEQATVSHLNAIGFKEVTP